jgi:hypothetical protein
MQKLVFGDLLDDPDSLFNVLNTAFFGTGALNLINRAGITQRLLQGPADTAELAALGAIPADQLGRVLDFLLAHGVLGRADNGQWQGTGRTAAAWDGRGTVANLETTAQACSGWLPALRAGRAPFEQTFGQPVFAYLATRPERSALFGHFMGWMTRRVTRFVFANHRFAPFTTVCDVGGSMGDLLLAVLAEYPGTRGLLFDLPETVELARPVVSASPLADRLDLVGGSFFDDVPVADLYLLKQILHDWTDAECTAILRTIRAAIPAHGRLVVIDHILSDQPAPDEAQGTDMAMMVWANGRERHLPDFAALFAASGFAIDRLTRNPAGHSVLELVPA